MDELQSLLDDNFFGKEKKRTYVDVILPFPLPRLYTYSVPYHLKPFVKKGVRVEVQLARHGLYSALVYSIHNNDNISDGNSINYKPILAVLDETPVVGELQLKFWSWLSEYYCCTLGDIMNAALPAGLKLASETKLTLNESVDLDMAFDLLSDLDAKELYALEYLKKYSELNIGQLQKLLKLKTVQPIITSLIKKGLILVNEELEERYKPKIISNVRLSETYSGRNNEALKLAFDQIGNKAKAQMQLLLALIQLSKEAVNVSKKALLERAKTDASTLKKLEEKGIVEIYSQEISRLESYDGDLSDSFELSEEQKQALESILEKFKSKNIVLLHGVTGSGKTQIYIDLIKKNLNHRRQTLFLLPEIALTAQIVGRLQKHFGDMLVVYHSKFNKSKRVEIWKEVQKGVPIIIGARSALFLPFKDLGLIIVDEEHDSSFKQNDPTPRYNARDSVVFLSGLFDAKVLLGSATPSLESLKNVDLGKYAIVHLNNRFGGIALPEINIVDMSEETKQKRVKSHFSSQLLEAIEETVANGEQVILFQNRRGYAPFYHCNNCGWSVNCISCDVSLTYHKYSNDLHCHYCGFKQSLPKNCSECKSADLKIRGFGTEKIEDELKIYLPDLKVKRMDWDSVKGRDGHEKIIRQFESEEIQVLVGTQMVTKGLDFDNVGLVGVISADQMLHFPDFRASERAYQMMLQVSGRAGRKKKQGKVIIQAFQISHPVLRELLTDDFQGFVNREMNERKDFHYPPFTRLIHIQLKHKKRELVEEAGNFFADRLKIYLGDRVMGPAVPGISRVKSFHLIDILLKVGLNSRKLSDAKKLILGIQDELKSIKQFSSVRVVVDVDPY